MKLNIEELAREADKDGIGWLLDEGLVHPDELERFARLLVDRCAAALDSTGNDHCAAAIRNLMED